MRSWIAILITLACAHCAPATGASPPGAFPAQSISTLTGEPADVRQMARGRVALVSFWATWCEACEKEFDSLNRLSARVAASGDGLVVGVAVGEPCARVSAFVRRRGLHYAQLVDENFRLSDALGQRDVPATLVLDRNGAIVYRGAAFDREGVEAFRRTQEASR